MSPGVLHVIAPAAFGGAESVVRGLARGRRSRGGEVAIAALIHDDKPHPFAECARGEDSRVAEIRCGRRGYAAEVRALAQLIREGGTEIVHTHGYRGDFVGYAAARRARVPVVATLHGWIAGGLRNRCYEGLDRRLAARFDAVLCVSEALCEDALRAGCRPDRVHRVANGYVAIPLFTREVARAELGAPDARILVGWVGRLSPEKGPDVLLEALARLSDSRVAALLVGEGPQRAALSERAASAGLGDTVRLVGARQDAGALLRAFDALVISSRTEGLPAVLLEAMAARVPVISSRVGAIPEVLNGQSGWLVPADDPGALAAALRELIENPAEADLRAQRAHRALAERFGADAWLDRVESVYAAAREGYPSRAS